MSDIIANLLKPETFDFVAKYFLAGYIVIIMRSLAVVGERPKASEVVIEAIILSLINQFIFKILIGLIPQSLIDELWTRFPFHLEVLFLPAFWGWIIGINLSKGWKNAIFRKLSMPVIHPIRRAHDYAFGLDRDACFVIVTYFDGTVVNGFFGENSLAASDSNRSDLYLERLYTVGDDDQWVEQTPGRSALIVLEDVRSVEFLDNQ